MKLKIKKLSEKRSCLTVKIDKDVSATTCYFKPDDGPEAVLQRLNEAAPDSLKSVVSGDTDFGFQLYDNFGVLLESTTRSIYRNWVNRWALRAKEVVEKGDFTVTKKKESE